MKSFKNHKNAWYAVMKDDGQHIIAKPLFDDTTDPELITGWEDGRGVSYSVYEDDKVLLLKKMDKITKHFKI